MYKLIYYYIYKLIEKRNPDPKFGAVSFVWLTQVIHIGFILAILKRIFDLTFPTFSQTYFYNKLLFMPIMSIWLIVFYYFFKKRSDEIIKFYNGKEIINIKYSIFVFSLVLIPLILMIQMLKK